MNAPASLSLRGPDGSSQRLVERGAVLPARARVVFATARPGQRVLECALYEDDERLLARARFELPAGLPANCWIPVEVSVGAALSVAAEARENLRRLRVDAAFDVAEASARHFRIG
ncbi:MAG: hypothetical protein D6731_05490 [Planctomycetota bacterium]|nr:MAG: hypothetical protein D6731_05490 [Planctomycetota bacterium]